MHTVHTHHACTVCGKHFINDAELEAMCGPSPSVTVQMSVGAVPKPLPIARAVPVDPNRRVPPATVQ
jgi:hypothetical protein